jgi:type IV pilus assembly protein PilP
MYKYAAIIISVFCFFFSGCEEKATPPPAKPKIVHKKIDRKPAAKAQPAVSSSVAEAGAAVESGSAGPEPTLTEQDLQDILKAKNGASGNAAGDGSGYSAKNRVDPFEPLFKPKQPKKPKPKVVKDTPQAPRRRLTPLEKVDLDQLKLVGIVRAESGNKALVEDASGKGYIVIHGTYIGIHSGKVVDILKDRVIVEEKDKDMLGKERVHKREMKFQRPSGDEYYEM